MTKFSIFILFIIPLFLIELIIYFVSFNPSLLKKEKMLYRMIRTRIQTDKENDEMWSTDDEPNYKENDD